MASGSVAVAQITYMSINYEILQTLLNWKNKTKHDNLMHFSVHHFK